MSLAKRLARLESRRPSEGRLTANPLITRNGSQYRLNPNL